MNGKMRRLRVLVLTAVLVPCASLAFPRPDKVEEASTLAQQGKWKEAAAAYRSAVEANRKDGAAWMGLGESQLEQSQFSDAKSAFEQAVALGFRPVLNRVNLARVAAKAGNSAEVYTLLGSLVADRLGGTARPIVKNATEFDPLLRTDHFRDFVEKEMAPCQLPSFHDFDFWIGDWKVTDHDGNVVGENLVTSEQDGCLLVEHWKSAEGAQTGSSFNYFDIRDKKWHQLYIDNSGNAGAFPAMSGQLESGRMILLTDASAKPLSRWTWYPMAGDHVRQMAEQSLDGGKTWRTTWDSIYVRKAH